MEESTASATEIKQELSDIKKEISDVKKELTVLNSEIDNEYQASSTTEDNDTGVRTVVLQNIQLGEEQEQLAIIGNIISQTNSDGNLQIKTLEDNNVIHTYIINNAEYEELDAESVIYEDMSGDVENSIEYIIEESVGGYEEETNQEDGVQYTEVQEFDEYEYSIEEADEESQYTNEESQYTNEESQYANEESLPDDQNYEEIEEERMETEDNDNVEDEPQPEQQANSVYPTSSIEVKDEQVEKCDLCSKVFKTSAGLKRHITVNHEKKELMDDCDDPLTLQLCPCCGEPWDSAHTIGDYKCDFCDKLFIQPNFLQRHLSIEHPKNNAYCCVECKKKCTSKEELVEHLKIHPVKVIKCLECNREFSRKYHLDRHILQTGCMGQPRKVYDCRVCKRFFTRKDNLAEHLRNHAGQVKKKKKFTCEFCSKEFEGLTLMTIHIRTHTGEKPYQCDLCPKKFPSSGALKKHRRMHTGEKPYHCQMCYRTFAAKETLNRHYRTHTGEKPHQCKFCGKSFIQPTQLRAHIFHHTGENAFTCSYCGRAFNRKLRLTNHIKFMHEGAQPLPCPKCEKTFFRKEDVNRHMLVHSGEKPFKCEVCNKGFAVKSTLKIHMNIHKKESPCICETCGRAFIRRDCLMRHIRARHRDVLEDILANAEKKRLQLKLLTFANESANENLTENIVWNELTLTESIKELLMLLVDEECLLEFGYPETPVDKVLDSVIRRCGHDPASEEDFDYIGRLRENAKLLFTVVIDDEAVKELLNNQTVDEVILHVLKLAKKPKDAS